MCHVLYVEGNKIVKNKATSTKYLMDKIIKSAAGNTDSTVSKIPYNFAFEQKKCGYCFVQNEGDGIQSVATEAKIKDLFTYALVYF